MSLGRLLAKAAAGGAKALIAREAANSSIKAAVAAESELARVVAMHLGRKLDTTSGKLIITASQIVYSATSGRGLFTTDDIRIPVSEVLAVTVKEHGWPWKRRCRLEVTTASRTWSFVVNNPDALAAHIKSGSTPPEAGGSA